VDVVIFLYRNTNNNEFDSFTTWNTWCLYRGEIASMIWRANTRIYNDVFVTQYKSLLKFARQDADNIHDSYLKTLNRITNKGFTAHTITELKDKLKIYVKTVIYNNYKTNKTQQKQMIDVGWQAENQLQLNNTQQQDERQYYDELQYFTQKLFEYLKKNYDEADQYVFRCYYLYDKNNRKITYEQLSKITGYSVSKVCGIIQKIKSDLKINLIDYINGTT
jgi:hypothetical protein